MATSQPAPWRPLPVLVLAAFGALGLSFVTPTLGDMGGDSAQYLELARSLASGDGYRDAHLPARPLHTHYPPGFPLLLVPAVALFGVRAYFAAKVVVLLGAVLGLWLALRVLVRRAGAWPAVAAVGLSATSSVLLVQSVRIQSETAFLALVFALLAVLEDPARRERRGAWILPLSLATGAFLVRWAGVACLATVALVELRRRGLRKGWLAAALAALPPLVWWLYTKANAGGTWSYGDELLHATNGLTGLAAHLGEGALFYLRALGGLVASHPLLESSLVPSLLLAVPVVAGLAVRLFRGAGPGELLFALTLALAVLAPARTVRYLLPVLPLAALYFLDGVRWLVALVQRRRAPGPAMAWAAAVVAVANLHALMGLAVPRFRSNVVEAPPLLRQELAPVAMHHWEEGWFLGEGEQASRLGQAYGDFLLLLQGIPSRVGPQAVLAARKPRLVSHLTGLPCVSLPDEMNADKLAALLQREGVTHVVADGLFVSTRRVLKATAASLGLAPAFTVRSSACLSLGRAAPGR